MILEWPFSFWKLGSVEFQTKASVLELEAGNTHGFCEGSSTHNSSRGAIRDDDVGPSIAVCITARLATFERMAIIVPTKNEPVDRLLTVLSGIPHEILVVLVSNSSRAPGDDKYQEEVDAVSHFCRRNRNRPAITIHQKDVGAGEAFEAAGETNITDGEHKVRNGKGEGMILGLAVVATFFPERTYVGFVDSDNTVPGAVLEYCNAYASAFYTLREEPNVMVRIKWGSKPKAVKNRIDYVPEGRSSTIVNRWLNNLLRSYPGASFTNNASGVMVTGNAGEHAMTMDLALQMPLAGGYAIEPYQIMALLERASGDVWHSGPHRGTTNNGITNGHTHRHAHHHPERFSAKVVQIHCKSPHIHRPSGDEHIRGMVLEGLGSIYHRLPSSPFAHSRAAAANGHNGDSWETQFKDDMLAYIEQQGLGHGKPPVPRIYKPLAKLDLRMMHSIMSQNCRSIEIIGQHSNMGASSSRAQNGHA